MCVFRHVFLRAGYILLRRFNRSPLNRSLDKNRFLRLIADGSRDRFYLYQVDGAQTPHTRRVRFGGVRDDLAAVFLESPSKLVIVVLVNFKRTHSGPALERG
jgi:hypothetical protein